MTPIPRVWEGLKGAGPIITSRAHPGLGTRPMSALTRSSPVPNVSLSTSHHHPSLAPHSCLRTLAYTMLSPPNQTLPQRQAFCWLLGRANPSPKGHLGQGASGPYLMTLKVLCSKRAVGVGRPRANACFRISMLRLQSSASFSNLPPREPCSDP